MSTLKAVAFILNGLVLIMLFVRGNPNNNDDLNFALIVAATVLINIITIVAISRKQSLA